jgi:endoglucanase
VIARSLQTLSLISVIGTLSAAAGPDRVGADIMLTGINLAGAEFQSKHIPGVYGKNYVYPTPVDISYFLNKGMNVFRLPFRWERLQHRLNEDFDPAELRRIDTVVNFATFKGAHVILDPHNYARYRSKLIGSEETPIEAFAEFWSRLASQYKDNRRVIFGLMNEPNGIDSMVWQQAASAAILAIRKAGANNLVLVPGSAWTGAHSWMRPRDGAPNAVAMLEVRDPLNNFAFEAHQYFDFNHSGTSDFCQSEDVGVQTLSAFTGWLRKNRHKGFLGEFGAAANSTCLAALDNTLKYIEMNSDVWLGWTYWAAGAWWNNYPFSVQPERGVDKPQMGILMRYGRGQPVPGP